MAVMAPKESWTDERLNHKVDEGFARLDKDIREVRGEIKELRGEMNTRFDGLQKVLIGSAATVVTGVIGSAAALIATIP